MRCWTATTVTVVALGLTAALTGCTGSDDEAPDGEGPTATPSETEEQGVVSEDGESTVTTFTTIPPDFPDDVPVLSPEDATGSVTEYDDLTSFSVVVESDQGASESLAEAAAAVADAGFDGPTEITGDEVPEPVVLERADPETVVVLSSVPVESGSLLTYTVEVS